MTKALVSSLLLCAALPLYAADVAITVVTPARTARSAADVPGQVEVITGRELEDTPGATLNDKLVNAVPGAVTNRSNGIYSFASVVSLRGLPASDQGRTLVLLDGVPVNTGATGAVNWNRLAAEDIDRMRSSKGRSPRFTGPTAPLASSTSSPKRQRATTSWEPPTALTIPSAPAPGQVLK
jgi:outer membrane cobalamin receptor